MRTHRRCGDETSISEILQLLAVDIGALFFLASPMGGGCAGTVVNAVDICPYDFAVMIQVGIYHGPLGPGNTGVGNEDIEAPIEFLDDGAYGVRDFLWVRNVNLVCST